MIGIPGSRQSRQRCDGNSMRRRRVATHGRAPPEVVGIDEREPFDTLRETNGLARVCLRQPGSTQKIITHRMEAVSRVQYLTTLSIRSHQNNPALTDLKAVHFNHFTAAPHPVCLSKPYKQYSTLAQCSPPHTAASKPNVTPGCSLRSSWISPRQVATRALFAVMTCLFRRMAPNTTCSHAK